jgi:hypothetical protein
MSETVTDDRNSIITDPQAELEKRVQDYRNYPPVQQGESYASRRRRLENDISHEVRRATGQHPFAGPSAPQSGETDRGEKEPHDSAANSSVAATSDSGDRTATQNTFGRGHPPALPDPRTIPDQVKNHAGTSAPAHAISLTGAPPIQLRPDESAASPEAATGSMDEPASEPASTTALPFATGSAAIAEEPARVPGDLSTFVTDEEQKKALDAAHGKSVDNDSSAVS